MAGCRGRGLQGTEKDNGKVQGKRMANYRKRKWQSSGEEDFKVQRRGWQGEKEGDGKVNLNIKVTITFSSSY